MFFTSVAQFEEAASAHVQKLNFPYGNSDCAECQTVVTPENFPYSFLPKSLYSRHSLLLVQYFPLSKFFWYLVYFRPLYQSMLKEVTSFFPSLLFSELCCRIPCNWKYIDLFLIGSWTTTSWGIYHQAFSATIPSWSGCKFGVFLNIGVRGTHGIQPSKQAFECVGDIAYSIYEKNVTKNFF